MTLLDMENKESILSALSSEWGSITDPRRGKSLQGNQSFRRRICELLTEPRKHYTRPDKFLRGFEKVCLVVSTVDCYGNIERSSTTMNGTSTECGSNSSVEDSSSGTKRSDEEEEDVDEDNTVSTGSVTPPRRPCINFYRSLTDRRPPSSLTEGLQKPTKEILLGSYSPGIPGKHTLQRPFLSGRTSSSFQPILEESDDSISGVDVTQERDEKNVGVVVMEDTDVEEDGIRIRVSSDSRPPQGSRSLTGLQKIFLENEAEETAKPTTSTVPPIDQMLRPMGQLEAFVNTISMVPSSPSSADATSATIATTTVSTSPALYESGDFCTTKNVDGGLRGLELSKYPAEMTKTGVDAGRKEEMVESHKSVEKAEGSDGLAVSRPSLKRESPTFDESDEEVTSEERCPLLVASPAKRVRVDDKDEESVDQGEFADIRLGSSLEVTHKEEMEEASIKGSFDNARPSLKNVGESAPEQERMEEEVKVVQKQTSGESSAIINLETDEHESI
ncbi:Serine/threonine-protein phosphatase 4 regulatory subunit 2 [Taenia crassiceps]|uniref:Serine/threonine-protein phosphatase 4 regulatory subunit 2 n=1 Tax=Taenia crassiceps TaxID=6207 RepID=A0ABR4QFW4_9CEST